MPPLRQRIETFKRFVDILGFGSVVWRFDPLILTDKISIEDLLGKIEGIGNQLKGFSEKLVFSLADISSYRKASGNLTAHGIKTIKNGPKPKCENSPVALRISIIGMAGDFIWQRS